MPDSAREAALSCTLSTEAYATQHVTVADGVKLAVHRFAAPVEEAPALVLLHCNGCDPAKFKQLGV
jgi:predicted alpha/beta hydrolase